MSALANDPATPDASEGLPDSHIAALPAVFMAADYKWELDGVWSSIRIGEPAPELDAAFPDARRFGMTAAANRSWREPSWLVVDMPVDRFDALSRSHGQLDRKSVV